MCWEVIGKGGVQIRKKEWLIKICYGEIKSADSIRSVSGDFENCAETMVITLGINPFSTVRESRRRIVKMLLKDEDPDDFLFYFPISKSSDFSTTLRQSFEKIIKFQSKNTTGAWMEDDLLFSHYYNKFDGSKNVST
jgi:hypothetical protein